MFVCVCNAVSHHRIAEAIEAGHSSADAVYAACGVQPLCRTCAVMIEEMILDHQDGRGIAAAE